MIDVEVLTFDFPLPPISEQERIVEILDEAFEGCERAIRNTEKALANAREIFESYLNDVFTQKGDDWVCEKVENLVKKGILAKPLDGNHGEIHPKKSDFVESGVPFIMASDLVNGLVDQKKCNFITRNQANSLRKGFAENGDVLLSHKGTIGRTAILYTFHENIVLTPQVTYYRIIDQFTLSSKFLYYLFMSQEFQTQMLDIAKLGSTRAYIGITKQLQLKISYPKLDEQQKYVIILDDLISATQRLETIYQRKLEALQELKQSILHQAFTGELTNPSIEEAVA